MKDRPKYIYRENRENQSFFTVVISKPGPRGGKRPPLMNARVRAWDYNDAVEFVEEEFLRGTKTEVTTG